MTNHNNGKTKLGLVSLIINDKEYKVPVNITISDDEIYFKCLVNSNSYVQALSEMIHNKLKKLFTAESDVPSTETIAAEGEKLFPAFINGVLSENTRIKELYNGISDVEDMMERFGIALEQNREEQIQKIREIIKTTPIADLQIVLESLPKFYFDQLPRITGITNISESFSKMINEHTKLFFNIHNSIFPINKIISTETLKAITLMRNDWQKMMPNFSKALIAVGKSIQDNMQVFSGFSESISKLLSKIAIPNISPEQKEQYKKSFEKWGEYGWTLPPDSSITLFYTEPKDILSARKIMNRETTEAIVNDLFLELRALRIKKTDLEEAIFCYKNKKYKSCANTLFGLIEAKMIRSQGHRVSKREVGALAVVKLREKAKKSTKGDINNTFLLLLEYANITRCLDVFFLYGGDFRRDPAVINRNYTLHGMNKRDVRQVDCKQLFLALYNLTTFLSVINAK